MKSFYKQANEALQSSLLKKRSLQKCFSCFVLLIVSLCISAATHAQTAPPIQWQKSLGGVAEDDAFSTQQTTDGGFIVAGTSYSNDGNVSGNHGNADYWIAKLDANGNIIWQKSLGGSGYDFAYSIQQTIDGGFIVAGNSDSNDGDVSGNHGTTDYWVVKLDADGNLVWEKSLGGSSFDFANSIQQTTDGGFIVAGESYSVDGEVSGHHGAYYYTDCWIVKLDADGNLVWEKSLGGTDEDEASSIQQTTDGGFIVGGDSFSNDGDVSGNHGNGDYWVVKLDANGNIVWQKCLGGSFYDVALSIQQTSDNGFIVTGISESNDGNVSGNHGGDDYWVVKLDADGNILWQKCLGGSSGDAAWSIQQTTDGGFIVGGFSTSNDGDVSGNHGGDDYWVVKLDANGNLVWQKSLGGSNYDFAYAVQQTTDGGFIVAGSSGSNDGNVSGNHGGSDYWVVKLSEACLPPKAKITPLGSLDICATGFVNLEATGGNNYKYQWLLNSGVLPGATNRIYHAAKTGKYQVSISDAVGCTAASRKTNVYSSCKLNERTELISALNLFPNPTNGTFNLSFSTGDEENTEAKIEVLNLLGQVIFSENAQLNNGILQKEIQLNDAASGMYIVKVTSSDRVYTAQINLQK